MDWVHKILQYWEAYYYTEPFEIICLIIALITGIAFAKKEFVITLFLIYTLAGLASILYAIYITHISDFEPTRRGSHIAISNLIVSYIEMSAFMVFFYHIFNIKGIRYLIKFSFLLCSLVNLAILFHIIFFEVSHTQLRRVSNSFITIQLTPLLVLCFYYYYQILNLRSTEDLIGRPSFWITTSLFFYILLIIPFILAYEELRTNRIPLTRIYFSTHYFVFGIIFVALSNGFICKKPITT